MADSRTNVTIRATYTPSRADLREAWVMWQMTDEVGDPTSYDRATAEAEFDRAWDVR